MAAQSFDELLSALVDLTMESAGFQRRGRKFVLRSEQGNAVVVRFRPYPLPALVAFHVEWAPIPAALFEYCKAELGGSPDVLWGVFYARLTVPISLRLLAFEHGLWSYDPATSADSFTQVFGDALAEAISRWRQALDREYVLAARGVDPDCLGGRAFTTGYGGPSRTSLFFDIDTGSTDELDQLLSAEEARLPGDEDIAWLRRRLVRRLSAPD